MSIQLDKALKHFPGMGCRCGASGESECGCPGADWSTRIRKVAEAWRDMSADEMRLRCGEMTAQEVRTVKSVLSSILSA